MKLILNIIKNVVIVFYTILAFSILLLFIEKQFNLDDYPNVFGYNILKVKSGSMSPTINVNDYVLTKKIDGNNAKVGDIVVYKEENYYVTHKLISKENDIYETKGDFNNISERINSLQVKAIVVLYGTKFTQLINTLLSPYFIILIGVFGLLIPDMILNKIMKVKK